MTMKVRCFNISWRRAKSEQSVASALIGKLESVDRQPSAETEENAPPTRSRRTPVSVFKRKPTALDRQIEPKPTAPESPESTIEPEQTVNSRQSRRNDDEDYLRVRDARFLEISMQAPHSEVQDFDALETFKRSSKSLLSNLTHSTEFLTNGVIGLVGGDEDAARNEPDVASRANTRSHGSEPDIAPKWGLKKMNSSEEIGLSELRGKISRETSFRSTDRARMSRQSSRGERAEKSRPASLSVSRSSSRRKNSEEDRIERWIVSGSVTGRPDSAFTIPEDAADDGKRYVL